jgi:hypothetical protein
MSLTTYGFGGAGAISVMGWGLGAFPGASRCVPKPKIVSSMEMIPSIVSGSVSLVPETIAESISLLPIIVEGTEDC